MKGSLPEPDVTKRRGREGLSVTEGQETAAPPGVETADGHGDAGVHDEEEHEGQDHGQRGVGPRQHSHGVQVVEVSVTDEAVLVAAHCCRPQGAAVHGHRRRRQHRHHRLGRYLTTTTVFCYQYSNIIQVGTQFNWLLKNKKTLKTLNGRQQD